MSYRDYKQFAFGRYVHLYNRGNEKKAIFLDDQDYWNYLKRLSILLGVEESRKEIGGRLRLTAFQRGTFSFTCYCLMPNHFHFCLRQNNDTTPSTLISRVCTSYAKYFNKKYSRVGHLFQDKFKMVAIDNDAQLAAVSAYIHQNPKVAGLVREPDQWPYSSYGEYMQGREALCEHSGIMDLFKSRDEYKRFVDERYEEIVKHKQAEFETFDEENAKDGL